jgi:hypothetical protein
LYAPAELNEADKAIQYPGEASIITDNQLDVHPPFQPMLTSGMIHHHVTVVWHVPMWSNIILKYFE